MPRDGYLYVVDCQQYADGTLSDPYLIFLSNRPGNENRVSMGRIVELPGGEDAFEVTPFNDNGKQLTSEVLTFIVSPRPLEGLPRPQAGDAAIPLPKTQVEIWESKWGAQVEQLELQNGAGKYRTYSEQRQASFSRASGPIWMAKGESCDVRAAPNCALKCFP